jgi:hypothetical protein
LGKSGWIVMGEKTSASGLGCLYDFDRHAINKNKETLFGTDKDIVARYKCRQT